MSHKIYSENTLDPVDNIGYKVGIITEVDHSSGTADVNCGVKLYGIPIYYNCPAAGAILSNGSISGSSKAFSRGDEVVVRMYKGTPSHIIGFKDELWACIKTPALLFTAEGADYALDIDETTFTKIDSPLFQTRYKTMPLRYDRVSITTYINDPNADISSGFVSNQVHWTDGTWNRDTKVYFNGDLIYTTLNSETYSHVFNGTRSNIISLCIHSETGWGGSMIYQVNTFHDWLPQKSGRVEFDFYLYTSTGTHEKIASAEVDVTSANDQATGKIVNNQIVLSGSDEHLGHMSLANIEVAEAGVFFSDGSTNYIGSGMKTDMIIMTTTQGTDNAVDKSITLQTNSFGQPLLPDGTPADFYNEIYVKKSR